MKRNLLILLFAAFVVNAHSQCLAPTVVNVSQISETTAQFSWSDFNSPPALNYDIYVVPVGQAPSAQPTDPGVTPPYTWTSGSTGEVYDVYVRANCNGSQSNYAGPITFQCAPTECVKHQVFDPPLVLDVSAGAICDSDSDEIDLDCDGVNDLFVFAIDSCNDPYYAVNSPSSVRLSAIGIEGIQFVSQPVEVNESGSNVFVQGIQPMNLGSFILTTELNPQAQLVDHGDEYSDWEGQGVKYVGFDLIKNGQFYNGWMKAEAGEANITIYETSINNRINDVMQIGQTDCTYCPADFDGSGFVDINDFLALNSAFGNPCNGCPEDITGDNLVNVNDFIEFNSAFGVDCSTLFQDGQHRGHYALIDAIDKRPELVLAPELEVEIKKLRAERQLKLYPNPTEGDYLRFEIADQALIGVVTVEVRELTGKLVWSEAYEMEALRARSEVRFNERLRSGYYVLSMIGDYGVVTQNFIVE